MRRVGLLFASLLCAACSGRAATVPEAAVAVPQAPALLATRLGSDTLAIERVRRLPDGVEATVVLRSPSTTLTKYRLRSTPTGQPTELQVDRLDPATGTTLESTTRSLQRGSGIPFIDMVHWPFELMVERAMAASTDTLTIELVAGDRLLPFRMRRLENGRFTATHPTRGTMTIEADAQGRLLSLDASATTRAVTVTRGPDADIATLARSFADRPTGELSGRGEVSVNVAGSQIDVDYGVPLKRGREIFGALVPWERVWRTGANRATHFSTTRALRFGDDVLPAGTYTLFTIPRPDRWTLLFNTNVDINGQAYDADADLLHVDLAVRRMEHAVEPFTIVVEPDGPSGGLLRLRWDTTEAWAPFAVQ